MMSKRGRINNIRVKSIRLANRETRRVLSPQLRHLAHGPFEDNNGDSKEGVFATLQIQVDQYSPKTEPKDKLTSDSDQDWINLAWELPSKGKKKALRETLKPKKFFRSMWTEAYRDIYTII